jgi:hypothetical protein
MHVRTFTPLSLLVVELELKRARGWVNSHGGAGLFPTDPGEPDAALTPGRISSSAEETMLPNKNGRHEADRSATQVADEVG